ncbi:MAG: type VI secretion system tube protein Hcp [Azoarcus sp.]|jgi:type VI secretion system secreted protein Hcp|nr:type VI secretion system tube protein Hcp [Azoarcus sp.]
MAFDAFMKIDGIPGESTDADHNGWIEVLSFDHEVIQPVSKTASSAGGGTAERAEYSGFVFVKNVDMASPKFYEASFRGTHIKEITIDFCRAGGKKEKYLQVVMKQVIVSKFKQCSGGEFPIEKVELSPGIVTMDYIKQDRATGTPSGSVAAGWNLITNTTA